ncbi:MAG: hypothetical protein ACOYKA_03920 [Legionellaceae bacterium]
MLRTFPTSDNKQALGILLFSKHSLNEAYRVLRPWDTEVKEAVAVARDLDKTCDALIALSRHLAFYVESVPAYSSRFYRIQSIIKTIASHDNPHHYVEGLIYFKLHRVHFKPELYPAMYDVMGKTSYPGLLAQVLSKASNMGLLSADNPRAHSNFNQLITLAQFCFKEPRLKRLLRELHENDYTQMTLDDLYDKATRREDQNRIVSNVAAELEQINMLSDHATRHDTSPEGKASEEKSTASSPASFFGTASPVQPDGEEKSRSASLS